MLDEQDRTATDDYGPWPWIGGFVIAAVIAALMFGLATGRL